MVEVEVQMILTSVWYNMGDKTPSDSGFYLAYKLPTIGDDSQGYDTFYWDKEEKEWREFQSRRSHTVRVNYWSAFPGPLHNIPEHVVMPTVAEIDAWKNVEDAISKYNMVKELAR